MDDRRYMLKAIELAKNGLGWVSPNPPVGCVIVSDEGRIVGEGWHQRYGEAHAEVNALEQAGQCAKGATAFVTLMPCSHHGKTPPCTIALINAGIKRVVVSVDDPDPVSGDGVATLTQAGISVEVGLLSDITKKVMHGFIKCIKTGLPHITLKYAMTLDGCIATASGDSKWISSEESRNSVQRLRTESDAVMVGSQTMLKDNPRLNVRDFSLSQPFRVIIDSNLITPTNAKIFSSGGGKVIILCGNDVEDSKVSVLKKAGAEVLLVMRKSGHLDLTAAMKELVSIFGIRSILCEGGSGMAGALIREKLVDRVITFIAPKMLGGCGLSPVSGSSLEMMKDAICLDDFDCSVIGGDVLCSGWIAGSLEL